MEFYLIHPEVSQLGYWYPRGVDLSQVKESNISGFMAFPITGTEILLIIVYQIARKIRQKERDAHKIFPFPGEVPQYLYHAKYSKESCCVLYTVFLHDTTKSKHFSC